MNDVLPNRGGNLFDGRCKLHRTLLLNAKSSKKDRAAATGKKCLISTNLQGNLNWHIICLETTA
jgi:hypothetical protein